MYPKIMIALHALHALNLFIAYHKKDLKILTVMTVCPVSKSDCQIERYRITKFAWSAWIVFR